jgi:hypothetical protein
MNIMWKVSLACGILGIALGAFLTKRFFPTQVETTKNNIITKTVTVTKPSGEKTTTIVVNDQSTKKEVISPIFPVDKKNYRVGILGTLTQKYAITVERKLLGDLSVVGQVNTDKDLYLGLSYAF